MIPYDLTGKWQVFWGNMITLYDEQNFLNEVCVAY